MLIGADDAPQAKPWRGYADQPSVNHKLISLTEYLPPQGPARCKTGAALVPPDRARPQPQSPSPDTPEVGAIIILPAFQFV
jgi:hypothetical protein